MSRARNIKPGFFRNELLVELPFEYRILFVGLWTVCDREGRCEDRPTRIRMEIFPADAVDVNAGLQALADKGFILRYQANGCRYIQVLAWGKHQNPHFKEVESTIPAPDSMLTDETKASGFDAMDESKNRGEPEASLRQAPKKNLIEEGRAVLIPDSLIPDSKIKALVPSERFSEFWEAYPKRRRQKKPDAEKVWKQKKLDSLADKIIADVKAKALDPDWSKENFQFAPMAPAYLRSERWLDAGGSAATAETPDWMRVAK